ncbi:MAG: hypothetical protein C0467_33255 [Planctomycetaceae bacterium]|nr:hypothetical protein [Planctomycetaceae bacterium]
MAPGEYTPDPTEGITHIEDLPTPLVRQRSRNYRRRLCPRCGHHAYRYGIGHRTLHDLSSLQTARPLDLSVRYSKFRCPTCQRCFCADTSDLAPSGSHYTHRVSTVAVRLVVEDGLPYRTASWHLWRDHRVFVPYATIQNWVEAAGKKGGLAA